MFNRRNATVIEPSTKQATSLIIKEMWGKALLQSLSAESSFMRAMRISELRRSCGDEEVAKTIKFRRPVSCKA
jgi:hypothetical protein